MLVAGLDVPHYFKGVELFIQAVLELPAIVKGLIVGDGNLRSTYEQQVHKLDGENRILFAGRVSDAELPDYYRLADVTVLPSLTMGEAFGLVLVKSMACGTPVIASNLPGVRTVVDDGRDGYLVQPGDRADLQTGLNRILSLPSAARQAMGAAGRRKVEQHYTWAKAGERLETIYRQLLAPDEPQEASRRSQPGMNSVAFPQVAAVPVFELTPLEYRIALDAASVWLAHDPPLRLRCDQPALLPEIEQRLPLAGGPPWKSGLWLEPQQAGWQAALTEFSRCLPPGARLAVLLSLPPARRLPERCAWSGQALGEQKGGLDQFRQAFTGQGFGITSLHGLHSGQAVLLNALAMAARNLGRLALGDRLEFAARKRYIRPLHQAWRATCALLLAVRR